jgi:transcriptional regulator GlxA family with amidase domain
VASETSQLSVVLFDGFELLDVCGPLEMFSRLTDRFSIDMVGPDAGPVVSSKGSAMVADRSYAQALAADIVLVPGGIGTRRLVEDRKFLAWLSEWAGSARYLTSVCTGSGLLAAAGLLDGFRATSNKRAFEWARSQSHKVEWVPQARWVEDRNRWTSAGVAAGMDMSLALIAHLHGDEVATTVADGVEYDWHRDPTWDPFAAKNGLVP